jgi:hypothetical protein
MPPEDIDRAIDTARRLLRAINAQDALAELDVLTGVTRSGVVRVPPKPRAVETNATGSRRRSPPSEWMALAESVNGAFISVFGGRHRKFGTKGLGLLGVCDDARGAQWSAATDLQSGQSWLAVNLEGIQYDGWPIARFIERELASPELPALQGAVAHPDQLIVSMSRDAWQAAGRVRILEHAIAPTPIALAAITPEIWRSVLQQARECLNPAREYRGRGQATVTLASSNEAVVRDVSPHFNIRCHLKRDAASGDWEAAITAARDALESAHRFVASQSR